MREAAGEMNLMSRNNDQSINEIIGLMQADKSDDAPVTAIRWSKNVFRMRRAAPKTSVVERVLAILQMDLSPNQAVFGERSAASGSPARQMLFQAGENALDVRIVKVEESFDLRGQILGEGFANGTVRLGAFETTADEISEFKLAKIPGGIYNLSVQINERELFVENLELK